MGPWTITRSSLRVLRRVAVFWRPLRPVFQLVSFPRPPPPPHPAGLGVCLSTSNPPYHGGNKPPPEHAHNELLAWWAEALPRVWVLAPKKKEEANSKMPGNVAHN